jgi:Uma2 family endonuclease
MDVTADLERQIIEAIPDWIEREPDLRRRLQNALSKTADSPPRFATFEEFIEWVDEDISAEWINGDVIIMSPASTQHQYVGGFLHHIIDFFVQKHQLGAVLQAPYKMKLENYGPEPDLLVVLNQNKQRIQKTYLDGPADLVVEIISPESVGRDRGEKFTAYEAAGIPEYWLIDPIRQQAEFYQLGNTSRYQFIQVGENGRYHSHILAGLWLQVDWLWLDPLPSIVDVLHQLELI